MKKILYIIAVIVFGLMAMQSYVSYQDHKLIMGLAAPDPSNGFTGFENAVFQSLQHYQSVLEKEHQTAKP